jgi:hypothetical protein
VHSPPGTVRTTEWEWTPVMTLFESAATSCSEVGQTCSFDLPTLCVTLSGLFA